MAETLWREIETALKAEIASGRYQPGEKLPTEAALARRFGVNRHTARRALAAMAEAGLILTRRGSGAFVAFRPATYPLGRRVRFHQSFTEAGRSPTKEILRLETLPAGPREAEALGLAPGEMVHVWEGIGLADGAPLSYFRAAFPAARLPGLKEGLAETRSVTAALAQAGIPDYVRVSTRLSAERARPFEARHLRLAEGAPLLLSVSVNATPGGEPVEYGRTWFAGDRVVLEVAAG
ncbi:MAG: phosphonate metabolism transcriptional regulator PhnF [Pikeienuella sp.]|uniref:phosphonate metabolism transcriptional regulator PhnF n=1 Tax=Pikeienuella sp. TaxID=2831957 RepID=UPI00391A05E4